MRTRTASLTDATRGTRRHHHAAGGAPCRVAAIRPAAAAARPEGGAAVSLTSGSAELTPQAAQTVHTLGKALGSEAYRATGFW